MFDRLVILCFISLVHSENTTQTLPNVTESTRMESNDISTPYPLEVKSLEKSLWLHRPEALQSSPSSPAPREPKKLVRKHQFLLTKLTRPLGFGVAPYFHKIYFEPFERRKKPVVILALKKQGVAPIKTTVSYRPPEVAILQSPYNEVDSHAVDDGNLNAEVDKNC